MTVRLMIPGPVPLAPTVQAALSAPLQPHYGEEWVQIWRSVLHMLAGLFGTKGDVFNLVGSGSAGLDAAIGSLVSPGDRVLISVNGFHGDRLAQMAMAHGADVVRVEASWGEPVIPIQFEALINSAKPPKALIVTHVETTTGVINPVAEIAAVGRRYGVLVMVDAVASLGGVPFAMDEWGVDICCSASQKCLGGAAGLAQIAINGRAWEAIESRARMSQSWYLDLLTWRDYSQRWPDWHPYPVTVPTHTTLALYEALRLLTHDGIGQRARHYLDLMTYLRKQVRMLSLELLVHDEWAAPVVTAICMPDQVDSNNLIDDLASQHHIKVGAGFGPLHGRVIRVGHMSPQFKRSDIDDLVAGLEHYCREYVQ